MRTSIARWIQECNHNRPHRGVRNRTPQEVFLVLAGVLNTPALTVQTSREHRSPAAYIIGGTSATVVASHYRATGALYTSLTFEVDIREMLYQNAQMITLLVLLSLFMPFTIGTGMSDFHVRRSSVTKARFLKSHSAPYTTQTQTAAHDTSGASREGSAELEHRPPVQKRHLSLRALAGEINVGWMLSVLALLVAYLTLREYRLGRRQSVKPFLILTMAGNDLKDYRLLLKNEGIGIAFDVNIFLEEPDRLLGSLDFLQAGMEREITVNLINDNPSMPAGLHAIVLKYHDIYGTTFRSRFLFRMSTIAAYSLPDPSSVELQEFSEMPRYARNTTLRLRR